LVYSKKFLNKNVNSLLNNTYSQAKELSVHFLMNKIRFWDVSTKFFITTKIFRYLDVNIRNRLKNIFAQVVNDNFVWLVVMQVNLLQTLRVVGYFNVLYSSGNILLKCINFGLIVFINCIL
jgi:hypothetical protein